MQRRLVIKDLIFIGSSIWLAPFLLTDCNGQRSSASPSGLTKSEETLLGNVVDTIIPPGEIPGATVLGVPLFVQRMVMDCFSDKDKKTFVSGLKQLDEYSRKVSGRAFSECDLAEREKLIRAVPKEAGLSKDLVFFVSEAKKLTVSGYISSKYYLTKIEPYEMVPGYFKGCIATNGGKK